MVDGDLVTARTGKHCHLFARQIIELLADDNEAERIDRLLESVA